LEALSIAEFITPHLAHAERVVDVSSGAIDLAAELQLPSRIAYERRDLAELDEGSLGPADILIGVIGPSRYVHGDRDTALLALRSLGLNGQFALLLGMPLDALPDDSLVDGLAAAHCQILELVTITGGGLSLAAIGRRTEQIVVPGPPGEVDDPLAAGLRLANRAALESFTVRSVPSVEPIRETPDPSANGSARRLAQRLRETEERLEAIETSTALKLGRTVVGAARSLRRAIRLVPDVVRIWRRRPSRVEHPPTEPAPQADAVSAWHASMRFAPERLLVAYSAGAAGARTRLVVAGVIREETASALDPDAMVHRMGPNDALLTLERADPDVILIETGAFSAGRPWAFAGSQSAVERDRQLARILDVSHALGRPTVLWRTTAIPEPIGIGELAGRFDLVLDATSGEGSTSWTPGVQLAKFNPIDLDSTRSGPPLFIGAWDARASGETRATLARLLASAALDGLEILVDCRAVGGAEAFPEALRPAVCGTIDLGLASELYRSHPVVISDPAADGAGHSGALEALACGARIVALPNEVIAGVAGDGATFVRDAAAAGRAIRAAVAAGPLPEPEVRHALRSIFAEHAVPVALASLVARLGLRAEPLHDRQVSLLLRFDENMDSAKLVDSALRQTHPPSEVVVRVGADEGAGRALEAFSSARIPVRVVSGESSRPAWPTHAAESTRPWVVAWRSGREHGPNDLLDLVAARECSGADVVGYRTDPGFRFVGDLGLEGTLIRRELLAADLMLDQGGQAADIRLEPWARRGSRLLGIAPTQTPAGG